MSAGFDLGQQGSAAGRFYQFPSASDRSAPSLIDLD
jgi:hypothetical protein